MKAMMTIKSDASWSLELTAESPTETAMLNAVMKGYGVNVNSGLAGDAENPILVINGEK